MKALFESGFHELYDASQLRSLYAFENFGVQGDSILGWIAPTEITVEKLIDRDDAVHDRPIFAASQVHYVVEMFGIDLTTAVLAQRLLNGWMARGARWMKSPDVACDVELSGNDVYCLFPAEIEFDKGEDMTQFVLSGRFHYSIPGCKKLSVSIATASPVSCLIHAGINVSTEGTPVQTAALDMLGIDPVAYGEWVAENFAKDYEKVLAATTKVRWVP
ncbi:MAG: DUF366 family protein [Candidatus Lernaella stagnicola]|nr:DUF366 family protein [Candidatus Lernaella stagnicola]